MSISRLRKSLHLTWRVQVVTADTIRTLATLPHASKMSSSATFIDIGANLLDSMFMGVYNEKKYHAPDFDAVLRRATEAGVSHIIVTASDLLDAVSALRLCRRINASGKYPCKLHTTVGVHPCSSIQLTGVKRARRPSLHAEGVQRSDILGAIEASALPGAAGCSDSADGLPSAIPDTVEEYIVALRTVIAEGIKDGTVVAIGECGLDYDRLNYSPKDAQLAAFPLHFDLAAEFNLPMFLHDRNTGGDFLELMRANRGRIPGGVVHSFTGTEAEMRAYVDLGLSIGINGCSLKTQDNCDVAGAVPLDRLMLETDAPWCSIKPTHASSLHVKTKWPTVKREKHKDGDCVKDRCEPCLIVQVAEVMAGLRSIPVADVADAALANTKAMFKLE